MKLFIALFIYLFSFQAHAWIVKADFEDGAVGQPADGADGIHAEKSTTVYSNEYAISGGQSAKSTIFKGTDGFKDWGGVWHLPTKLKEGDEMWYRVWAYYPKDFNFSCGCSEGIKFMRMRTYAPDGTFEGSHDYYLTQNSPIMASGVNGPTFYENHPYPFEDIRKIGVPITNGVWHAYEHYVKFSVTPGKGILRAWQDGKLIFEDKITATLETNVSEVRQATLWTYWNNLAPATQSAYVDDVIITNEVPSNTDEFGNSFIGTGGVTFLAKPNPPTPIIP